MRSMATEPAPHPPKRQADAADRGGAPPAGHYFSARRRSGRDECVWCDAQGQSHGVLALPARGHSIALDAPRRRAVVFGRQPGGFAYGFTWDAHGGVSRTEPLPLPAGHHFYGHGVYAQDGQTLYTTENDYHNARGVIGVYDARPARNYARIGEFASGGIGPHELVLLPDGQTLCVANGGLQTHPDFGKTILNLATMQSCLTYLDRQSGQILEMQSLEPVLSAAWRHLSLRHLAVDGAGHVWAGGQYVNPDGKRPALVWRHVRGRDLQPAPCPPAQTRAMRNYVGSVAVNRRGDVVAASSPVGGQALCWAVPEFAQDRSAGAQTRSDLPELLGVVTLPDVCGIAPWADAGFLFSSGFGALLRHGSPTRAADARTQDVAPTVPASQEPLAWDNHLSAVFL